MCRARCQVCMLCVPCAPVPARPAAEMTKKNQRPIIKICRSVSPAVKWCNSALLCQMEEQNERDDEIREATERLSNRELAEYKEIFRFFDKGHKRQWAVNFGFLKNRWVEISSKLF